MKLVLEIKVSDGLGNQFFQYATARSLCIQHKIPYLLLVDENLKNNRFGRTFLLSNYPIKGKVVSNKYVKGLLRSGTNLNKLLSLLPFYHFIKENALKFQPLSQKVGFYTALQGHWQSELYFKNIRTELLQELIPFNIPEYPSWINFSNTVAVHVRRADYLGVKEFGFLGVTYYKDAIAVVKQRINNPLFIFFSDDISWCMEHFNGEKILYCTETAWAKDFLQLHLMSKCAHNIIANSSFSWWGAWLNQNPEKIVLRPETPFVNSIFQNEAYYPKEWVSISNSHQID